MHVRGAFIKIFRAPYTCMVILKNKMVSNFESITALKVEQERENLPFSLLQEGIPKGGLTEVSGELGNGKTEVILKFLAENLESRVAWVEQEFTIYPGVFFPLGLGRVLFIEAIDSPLWSVHQLLRSQLFGIVVMAVCSSQLKNDIALRRLQLEAEKAKACVLLITESPRREGRWPLTAQIWVERKMDTGEPVIRILKYRGMKPWMEKIG
jgi:hypothetical protein